MDPYKFFKKIIGRRYCVCFLIGLATNVISAKAQQAGKTELRMTPQEIIAAKASGATAPGSSNSSAVQVIVIYGDPSKAGLYTILLKVAANTKIAAHLHPDERVGTVVSGTWYFGYGDQFEEGKLKELPVGSVYSEVEAQNHFAMTGKEAVIVEITGYGPSGVTYVNEADDPQKKN
ncbi:MAG: cupin domain-containing protein [Ferruginibacter sp.]